MAPARAQSNRCRVIGLRGASDAEIAVYAQEHGLCLLTGDMGFADIRNYSPGQYPGIVVLRLPAKATSSTILTMLKSLLVQTEIVNQLNGKLAIVELGRIRFGSEDISLYQVMITPENTRPLLKTKTRVPQLQILGAALSLQPHRGVNHRLAEA
ncbi:MAG: DUF5615 family PIN-like protein [Dehalococcoidales bacterium]|nr:DUF5615 family PIN-like protein [Dehalococcoidales bacterium]